MLIPPAVHGATSKLQRQMFPIDKLHLPGFNGILKKLNAEGKLSFETLYFSPLFFQTSHAFLNFPQALQIVLRMRRFVLVVIVSITTGSLSAAT